MNIHGGVSARCFITPSHPPAALSPAQSPPRFSVSSSSSSPPSPPDPGSRRVNQYATPHRALLIFRSSLTHANIFADRPAREYLFRFMPHLATIMVRGVDRYDDETDQNRLEPIRTVSLSFDISVAHCDKRDRLVG